MSNRIYIDIERMVKGMPSEHVACVVQGIRFAARALKELEPPHPEEASQYAHRTRQMRDAAEYLDRVADHTEVAQKQKGGNL